MFLSVSLFISKACGFSCHKRQCCENKSIYCRNNEIDRTSISIIDDDLFKGVSSSDNDDDVNDQVPKIEPHGKKLTKLLSIPPSVFDQRTDSNSSFNTSNSNDSSNQSRTSQSISSSNKSYLRTTGKQFSIYEEDELEKRTSQGCCERIKELTKTLKEKTIRFFRSIFEKISSLCQ